MDRNALLAAKAAELNEQLEEWAKSNLAPGEKLIVSLQTQQVPVVEVIVEDFVAKKQELLSMKVPDFFTWERFASLRYGTTRGTRVGSGVATRLCNYFREHEAFSSMTLGQFVQEDSYNILLHTPRFGHTTLNAIRSALATEELEFEHSF